MEFYTGQMLLALCAERQIPISQAMRQRELDLGLDPVQLDYRLNRVVEIMKQAAHRPVTEPRKAMGGLIGGEARKLFQNGRLSRSICGPILSKAVCYSMAVLEENASMGLIVAAPTAGSSGVVPGTLFALQEERQLDEAALRCGLLNAGAIGYLLMRNASVSGAEAGCQAEVGSASAMAASALVEMLGGTPEQSLAAATFALSNLLGLVCDPIAGLVESPCQSRNAIGAANAILCAELALAGIRHAIPFDEMVGAMDSVGRKLPAELRETAMGGCAATPTGCRLKCYLCS